MHCKYLLWFNIFLAMFVFLNESIALVIRPSEVRPIIRSRSIYLDGKIKTSPTSHENKNLNANEKKKESTHLKKQHLAKRQFKLSINGSWLVNEQAMLLRREKQKIENEILKSNSENEILKSNSENEILKSNSTFSMAATNNCSDCSIVQQTNSTQTDGGGEKITVKQLISSLVTLFDKLKAVLLDMANKYS
jgi:hypothetical protein